MIFVTLPDTLGAIGMTHAWTRASSVQGATRSADTDQMNNSAAITTRTRLSRRTGLLLAVLTIGFWMIFNKPKLKEA